MPAGQSHRVNGLSKWRGGNANTSSSKPNVNEKCTGRLHCRCAKTAGRKILSLNPFRAHNGAL